MSIVCLTHVFYYRISGLKCSITFNASYKLVQKNHEVYRDTQRWEDPKNLCGKIKQLDAPCPSGDDILNNNIGRGKRCRVVERGRWK